VLLVNKGVVYSSFLISIYIILVYVVGECVCNMCFMRNSSNGRCGTCVDYPYSRNQTICGIDSRPKQLTAFLLSLFLSSTGAANFYIKQNSLGKEFAFFFNGIMGLMWQKGQKNLIKS